MPRQKTHRPHARLRKIIGVSILILLGLSVLYSAWRLLTVPAGAVTAEGQSLRQDYVLSLLQCLMGFIVMFLPAHLDKRFHIVVPDRIQILYFVFLYMAIFLGEVRNFYYRVPFWDDVLHAFSGGMLAVIGLLLVNLLNGREKLHLNLSPFFVVLFAVSFAILAGVVWEIYEFAADGLLGTNMQKFMTYDGTQLTGRAALTDTMMDLIIDLGSATLVGITGYFSLRADANRQDDPDDVPDCAPPAARP